jgi:hypothetical protein
VGHGCVVQGSSTGAVGTRDNGADAATAQKWAPRREISSVVDALAAVGVFDALTSRRRLAEREQASPAEPANDTG